MQREGDLVDTLEFVLCNTGVSVGFTFWGVVFYQSFTLVEPGQQESSVGVGFWYWPYPQCLQHSYRSCCTQDYDSTTIKKSRVCIGQESFSIYPRQNFIVRMVSWIGIGFGSGFMQAMCRMSMKDGLKSKANFIYYFQLGTVN